MNCFQYLSIACEIVLGCQGRQTVIPGLQLFQGVAARMQGIEADVSLTILDRSWRTKVVVIR